jgi:hypothetical protein
MNKVTPEFQALVERLIGELRPSDCLDAEEYRLAREFHALPLGMGLWAYDFLTPDGELISADFEMADIQRYCSTASFIRSVVSAAGRYPQLKAFIPKRPEDAIVCPACQGTKLWGRLGGTNKPGPCVFCAGLGWTVGDA